MSIAAWTNRNGVNNRGAAYVATWNGADGSSWSGSQGVTNLWSSKSHPYSPSWIRDPVTRAVLFKRPTNYKRFAGDFEVKPVDGVQYKANGSYEGKYREWTFWRTGNHPSLLHMPFCMKDNSDAPYWDSNIVNQAEVECLLKFKEKGMQLGNALAEAKSTVSMICDTASTLTRALLAMKRGGYKHAWRLLGANGSYSKWIANNYLQWKFGWAPLMTDIRDAVLTLEKQLTLDNMIVRNSRTIRKQPSWAFTVGSQGRTPNYLSGSGWHETTVMLWCKFKPDKWRQAASLYGLDNPLGVLWEVTPWSFVVDWLVPVGNLLEALAVSERLEFVAGFKRVRAQGESEILVPLTTNLLRVETQQTIRVRKFALDRVVYSTLPFPKPYVKSPFSDSHSVTALALLRQLLR